MSLYVIGIIVSCTIIGAVAANIGLYSVLQKKSLITDAISHALLPGVMVGFLIAGEKNPWSITICATLTGLAGAYFIDFIVKKTPIKSDAAIGISLSVLFGLGVVLLTYIQNTANASQSGLESFLLGNAASMQQQDLVFFCVLGIIIAICTRLLSKEFNLISFNPEYANAIGIPTKRLQLVLRILMVLTIVAGVQAVGVVLMAACLIIPSIVGRYWSANIRIIKNTAWIVGAFCGGIGAYFSYAFDGLPTGPVIVLLLSVLAFISVFIGGNKGLMLGLLNRRKSLAKIHSEHVLKTIFRLSENSDAEPLVFQNRELYAAADLPYKQFNLGLQHLRKQGYVTLKHDDIFILREGQIQARKIVRLHRLWELYLLKRLNLPADHVHENAEQIEHILTPKIEAALLKDLNHPTVDPHKSKIPHV